MTFAPLAARSRLAAVAVLGLASVATLAAAPACNAPRPADASELALDSADAGELTCEELLRARSLCLDALATRCRGQENECEVACESRAGMTGNTQKAPSSRNEVEAVQCRESCRGTRDACLRSVAGRCPAPCS